MTLTQMINEACVASRHCPLSDPWKQIWIHTPCVQPWTMDNGESNKNKRARISRPWDRRRDRITAAQNRIQERLQERQQILSNTNYIEVKGQRFYADRFYLNRTIQDNHPSTQPSAERGTKHSCTCGAKSPPPLLDRSALVASLDLKAAILATYTVDGESVFQEFPTLFGPTATVPTLVLHGRKISQEQDKEEDEDEDSPQQDHGMIDCEDRALDSEESLDDLSVGTQPSETKAYAAGFWNESKLHRQVSSPSTKTFPPHVTFTEITSTWISPVDLPSTVLARDGSLCETIVQKRKYKKGVHHPKFMMLFEKSGSVVIVVSTANLTSSRTTDGTWLQRFGPALDNSIHMNTVFGKDCCPGRVLGHFMDCQTWAAQSKQLTPLGFGRKHLGWKTQSCQELARYYDFSKSQVFLVPHVPGDHDCGTTQREKTSFRYGRQFVSYVLDRVNKCDASSKSFLARPWLPSSLISDQDRLVIQPTSLGGEWTHKTLSETVASYIGDCADDDGDGSVCGTSILDRLDIVWPTDDFVRSISSPSIPEDSSRSVSPNSVAIQTGFLLNGCSKKHEDEKPCSTRVNNGYLFLSSQTFNSIHIDCLSRMVIYEPSMPPQTTTPRIPHFKSIARLFGGKRYRIQKDFGMGKSDEYFPWFLLTSACLSRGAQGIEVDGRAPGQKTVSYTNFELGVLFCSRLQGKAKTDRLYCWKPACCSCSPVGDTPTSIQQQRPQLVHLPIPYDLRPAPYHEEAGDMLFCETPYFNEISKGTGTTGHMKLTPFGSSLAKIET